MSARLDRLGMPSKSCWSSKHGILDTAREICEMLCLKRTKSSDEQTPPLDVDPEV